MYKIILWIGYIGYIYIFAGSKLYTICILYSLETEITGHTLHVNGGMYMS